MVYGGRNYCKYYTYRYGSLCVVCQNILFEKADFHVCCDYHVCLRRNYPSYIVVNKLGLYDSRWALIIPTAISAYNLIVARSFFESLPEELTESAHLDGANDFVILWKIIVPISKPIISVLIIFYAVGHWNEYFYPLIYLKSRELKPIQLYLRDILVANQQASTSTGGSTGVERQYLFEALKFSTIVITTLPITIIYPFFQKHFVQGIMIGAVKS